MRVDGRKNETTEPMVVKNETIESVVVKNGAMEKTMVGKNGTMENHGSKK